MSADRKALASGPPGRRSLLWLGVATLVALAILLSLGTWQLQRLAWKEDLIARIHERASAAPVQMPPESDWPAFSPAEKEFTRVEARGRYEGEREVRVHGLMPIRRGQAAQGFYILTPLRLAEGGTVIVNRGFVPTEIARAGAVPKPPEGEVTVTGALRPSEQRTLFLPENDPARDTWFVRDLGQIATARGLTRVAPFLIEAEAAPGAGEWPRPVASRLELPNNHLQYAFTWYAFAAVLVAVFVAYLLQARRRAI